MLRSGITTGEAALYLGCSPAALRAWRRSGSGPQFFRAGRLIRYRVQDLDKWIAMHLHPASSPGVPEAETTRHMDGAPALD